MADLRAFLFVLPIADDEGGSLCRLLIEKDILSHRRESSLNGRGGREGSIGMSFNLRLTSHGQELSSSSLLLELIFVDLRSHGLLL